MKIKNKIKICLICLLMIGLPGIVMADEDLIVPEYSEEYIQWMELPDEEKENYIEPQAYEVFEEEEENEVQSYSLEIDTNEVGATNLPAKYTRDYYGKVKNQGRTDSCWAQSAATAFDTNYYVTNSKKKEFSNFHMDYMTSKAYNQNGFNRVFNSGGNINLALAYATNNMGIALESNMPKSNITSDILSNVKKDAKVSEYLPLNGQSEIKQYLYKYGVISAYTYMNGYSYFSTSSIYYNTDLAYCCTNANQSANHAITLIGWNDQYTNSAFPGKTGAYLALNSYGTSFGNNGLFYIFYEDIFVNETLFGVTRTTDIDYDYMYQHDPYGWTGKAGLSKGTYAANVFSRQNTQTTEELYEVSSFFPQKGNVTIYINANGNDLNIANATSQLTTYISKPGYYTLKLSTPVKLKNNKFSVCIKYPGYIFAEIPTPSGWASTATSNPGESYMSSNGSQYYELQEVYAQYGYKHANCCIKAYTKKVEETIKPTQPSNKPNNEPIQPSNTQNKVQNIRGLPNYVFDLNYYIDQNPDVVKVLGRDGQALVNHYINYGIKEGRRSSPTFCVADYMNYNQDLIQVYGKNYTKFYEHFINYGVKEGRRGSSEFDVTFYKYYYADLTRMSNIDLYKHYINYGKNEGRIGGIPAEIERVFYDEEVYKACNYDLITVFGNDGNKFKMHWIQYGINEGRISSLTYISSDYKNYNRDLIRVIGSSNRALFEHFVKYGINEGRRASLEFDVSTYASKNSDIKLAYKNNYKMYYSHFANFGINEGRQGSKEFSINAYMAKNTDLKKVYGNNKKNFCIHYIIYGRNEGRRAV